MSTSVHPSVPSTTIYTQHPPATVYVLPVSHLKYSPSPIMKCWILSSQLERPMVSNAQSFQPRVFQLILILSDVLYTNYLITSYISLNLGYWTYNKVCIFFFFFYTPVHHGNVLALHKQLVASSITDILLELFGLPFL